MGVGWGRRALWWRGVGQGVVEGEAPRCMQTWKLLPGSTGEAVSPLLVAVLSPILWTSVKTLRSEVSVWALLEE